LQVVEWILGLAERLEFSLNREEGRLGGGRSNVDSEKQMIRAQSDSSCQSAVAKQRV
jgi:hypothetical protein